MDIQIQRDEFGNADLVGVDMTALLGSTAEEMDICTAALNMLADYIDIGTVEQLAELAKVKGEGRLVEVVRCKDCKNRYKEGLCAAEAIVPFEEDYCGYGEPKSAQQAKGEG